LIGAFRTAARINDEDEDENDKERASLNDSSANPNKRQHKENWNENIEKRLKSKYRILDSGVFNFIVVSCLKNLSHIFDLLINRDPSKERY
jgi:hypothetical protein